MDLLTCFDLEKLGAATRRRIIAASDKLDKGRQHRCGDHERQLLSHPSWPRGRRRHIKACGFVAFPG
jgi:hypothetical protein